MNLKLWLLSLFGVIMGFASVYGFTQDNEWIYWLIIGLISGYIVSKVTDKKVFVKSVVIGLFMGIFTGIIQSAMFDTYLLNNPKSLDGFKQIPVSLEPQYVLLFAAPFTGIVFGLFIGLVAFIFNRIKGNKNINSA